ncbi:uncharacterized protein TNCV_4052591 [Trichonephila clavipes]|nr:uncharacterized protein TNCV_4052591 [Trichonephila clavipes]
MIVSRCVAIDGACLTEEADTSEDGGRIASKKEWQRGGQSVQMCGRVVWHRCIQEGPKRAIERQRGPPFSGPIIQEKAIQLNKLMNGDASFSASIGWLDRWKKRHGVRQLTNTGEKLSSDFDAAKEYVTTFANLIAEIILHNKSTMPMRRA